MLQSQWTVFNYNSWTKQTSNDNLLTCKFIIQLQSMGYMNLKNNTPRMHHITPLWDEKFVNFLRRGCAPLQTPLAAYGASILASSAFDLRPPQCSSGVNAHGHGVKNGPNTRLCVLTVWPFCQVERTILGVIGLVLIQQLCYKTI